MSTPAALRGQWKRYAIVRLDKTNELRYISTAPKVKRRIGIITCEGNQSLLILGDAARQHPTQDDLINGAILVEGNVFNWHYHARQQL